MRHGSERRGDRKEPQRRLVDVAEKLGVDRGYLRHTDFRVGGGRRAMEQLLELDQPPDAVFAANNLTGVGVLEVLVERGLKPPAFGLAIFGDLPFATLAPTEITIVHLPSHHLGATAARVLLERIDRDSQPARAIVPRSTMDHLSGAGLDRLRRPHGHRTGMLRRAAAVHETQSARRCPDH